MSSHVKPTYTPAEGAVRRWATREQKAGRDVTEANLRAWMGADYHSSRDWWGWLNAQPDFAPAEEG